MSPFQVVTIKARRLFVVAVAVAAVAFPVAAFFVGHRANNNCQGIHRLVRTLTTMINNSDAQITKYERDGLLTHTQAVGARAQQAENRRLLAGADCT